MRLVTFRHQDQLHAGAVKESGVVDLSARLEGRCVRQIVADQKLREAENISAVIAPDHGLDDVVLELPIGDAPKIFCVGVNYMNRNDEYGDGSTPPEYPSLFMRSPLSFSRPGGDILIPRESNQFDYEGEIVIVVAKAGRRIPQALAHDYIAGLTIMNEGSVRDWLRHSKFNVTPGKNFDRSGSFGPWIETDLSGIDLNNMKIETRVNGEVRQSDTTASMVFPFARTIEYISTFATLQPGDIIATGTPTGAGARFDPPKWLVAGDVVEVTVEGIGTLRNTVAAEPAA